MTTFTDPPKESFRLGMLIYDTRYRAITIQVVALIGFLLLIGWLISNTAQNLADLGKEPSFSFLWEASGYDINQRLIEYTSQSTHMRAAMVGLLNTLLVAALGCVTATVLGVTIGVLRLSKNWLVAKVMTVYVETFRNVPVLLWIVFTMAIIIDTLPQPNAYRGANPSASMYLNDSIALTGRGFYVPRPVFDTGSLAVILVFIASLIGIWLFGRWARARQEATGRILPTGWIKTGIFILPTLVVFLAINFTLGLQRYDVVYNGTAAGAGLADLENPKVCATHNSAPDTRLQSVFIDAGLTFKSDEFASRDAALAAFAAGKCNVIQVETGTAAQIVTDGETTVLPETFRRGGPIVLERSFLSGFNFQGGTYMRNSLIALWLALSLYTAAFIAEIVRAGILAISHGQTEAAAALGLRNKRIMSLVVLPQALRVIIPPLISNYLNLTKNSSLAIAVGYMDITGTLGGITLNQTGRELETLLLLMLCYLIISLTISAIMNWYNESVKLRER